MSHVTLFAITALLLLGAARADVTTVNQPSIARRESQTLRWRSSTVPPGSYKGSYVLSLAVGKDGTIYAGTWTGREIYAFAPDGTLLRKLDVDYGVRAMSVDKDGTIYAATGSYVYVFDSDGTYRSSLTPRPQKFSRMPRAGPRHCYSTRNEGRFVRWLCGWSICHGR
jgi:outer membrane protein assembly factor BamB